MVLSIPYKGLKNKENFKRQGLARDHSGRPEKDFKTLDYTNPVRKLKWGISRDGLEAAAIFWFVWVWRFVYNQSHKKLEGCHVRFEKRLGN